MISTLVTVTDSKDVERACLRLQTTKGASEAVVCAGDVISTDASDGFLRGHGTQADATDELRATQCGLVHRVNKLVSVQPLQQRYTAELGDVIVGRVVEILGKRWKLDLHSHQEASLMLSAVNLPGGVQRRRTVEDELNMRSVFREGDLLSAEIQQLFGDGSVALHTRSTKYGKLEAGQLVSVSSNLVPRQRKHFCTLPEAGVDLILGVNGMIWISAEAQGGKEGKGRESTRQQIESIARVANAIRALAKLNFRITAARLSRVVKASQVSKTPSVAMLQKNFLLAIIDGEVKHREAEDDL